ncbi:conserved hypothetical protein [Candidatus Zixiibacteriota bacterium]|nr:conserved hypothetical protein [candidate division Zixibacteria bacterium]
MPYPAPSGVPPDGTSLRGIVNRKPLILKSSPIYILYPPSISVIWYMRGLISIFVIAVLATLLLVAPIAAGTPRNHADSVVVFKGKRELILYKGHDTLKIYDVALGKSPVGPKERQGDQKTPEGRYIIDWRNSNSQFHLSLHISYPNAIDRARADSLKVRPGGDIMIHGLPAKYSYLGKRHLWYDWTNGCIAVTNEEIEEIWELVRDGTPIAIYP